MKIDTLSAFVDLLRREQTLLTEGNIDALSAVTEAKLLLVRDLEPSVGEMDEKFLHLAREAQVLNEANGKLISLHMQHNRQSLAVLTEAAKATHVTYGPHGQTLAMQSGRLFGTA